MADPVAKLYYNDFNIEGVNNKSAAVKNMITTLKGMGVEIDGVGLQSHFTVGGVASTLKQNMEELTALGVEVAITELDIRMVLPATQADIAQQVVDYNTVISACEEVEGCVGVTVWDFTDKVRFFLRFLEDAFLSRVSFRGSLERLRTHPKGWLRHSTR